MASSTSGGRKGDMKGFFKQKKKSGGGIVKPKGKKSSPKHSATFASITAQPSALISHDILDFTDDYDEKEEVLRQFDMNMAYGPCVGMTRLARWERACSLGLNPPQNIEALLREPKVRPYCLWDGRV